VRAVPLPERFLVDGSPSSDQFPLTPDGCILILDDLPRPNSATRVLQNLPAPVSARSDAPTSWPPPSRPRARLTHNSLALPRILGTRLPTARVELSPIEGRCQSVFSCLHSLPISTSPRGRRRKAKVAAGSMLKLDEMAGRTDVLADFVQSRACRHRRCASRDLHQGLPMALAPRRSAFHLLRIPTGNNDPCRSGTCPVGLPR
jgi:hypothetical protein